jgi:hypothetical protein
MTDPYPERVKPLTPQNVLRARNDAGDIQDKIIEIFNKAILKEFDGKEARISVLDISFDIAQKLGLSTKAVLGMGYLMVDEVYAKAGWSVQYGKSGNLIDPSGFYVFKFNDSLTAKLEQNL